jgi:hypothetical protein
LLLLLLLGLALVLLLLLLLLRLLLGQALPQLGTGACLLPCLNAALCKLGPQGRCQGGPAHNLDFDCGPAWYCKGGGQPHE